MKLLTAVFLALLILTSQARATDTTPPTLAILNTWCEKEGTKTHFKMFLEIRDETGLPSFPTSQMDPTALEFRSALNTTNPPPASAAWNKWPWRRGEAFDIPFTCTAVSFEFRARDAAGNYTPVQRRTFKSPFPYTSGPPALTPMVMGIRRYYYGHKPSDCQGIFAGKFNLLDKDALLAVDRATGNLRVLQDSATFGTEEYEYSDLGFAPNTITDSAAADFDGDGFTDLALVVNGSLLVYHNDGPDTNTGKVRFSPGTGDASGTLITTIQHIAVGDVTGEGKPEIICTGPDANGDMRIGWVINDGTSNMNGANSVHAVATTNTGRLVVADMNGDGKADVVSVDQTNSQLVIYKNKGQPYVLAGIDDTDTTVLPVTIPTGAFYGAMPPSVIPSIPVPADALAVGDVTGDGRPDIVVVMRYHGYENPLDSNDGRTFQKWRIYHSAGNDTFRATDTQTLGSSPNSEAVAQVFTSDVLLQDLNEDGLPELIFSDYFHNNLQITRLTPQLNSTNVMTSVELETVSSTPQGGSGAGEGLHTGPARLVTGVDSTNHNHSGSFGAFFNGSDSMLWFDNITSPSSLPRYVVGGCTTDSDEEGIMGSNGIRTYSAFPGDSIYASVTAINNTDTDMIGANIDLTLASNVSIVTDATDPGWGPITISGAKYTRWTVDIPARSAVVRKRQTRILTGAVNSFIYEAAYLRQGASTTALAGINMPFIKLGEPLDIKVSGITDSNAFSALTAHAEEKITYNTRVKNLGEGTLAACKAAFPIPTNTLFVSTSNIAALDPANFTYVTTALGTFHSDGQSDVGRWQSFVLHTTGRMVIDSNGKLQVCSTTGTTGSSEPAWATVNNKTTNDGSAVWTCKGQVTALSWPDFDLQPNANVTFPTVVKIYPNIGLGDSTATKPKITCNAVSITRPTNIKQTAPAIVTEILPQLEMDLTSNPIAARPGELVTCVLTVRNYGLSPVTNARAVYKLPEGVTIENVYTPDHADAPDGEGNFDADPLPFSQLYTVPNPVYDPATRVLSWSLGKVPANVVRRLKFQLQVQYDLAGHYYTGGQYNPVNVVHGSYNFVATSSGGKRLFAALPPSIPTASPVSAASNLLLSTKVPARTIQISEDAPLTPPTLTVEKSAIGDGSVLTGSGAMPTVINDTGVSTDGYFTYSLHWENIINLFTGPVPGTARQVAIRDFIPTGCNFAGFITRSFLPVSDSYLGFKFYDAAGKELKVTMHEAFTDTNGNGFYDLGEPYTDNAPRNGRFDGVAASAIRSILFPVGDVPGHQFGTFQYKVQAIAADGAYIDSYPALLSKTGVLTYSLTSGFYTTASNLLFPVPTANVPVRVLVTKPAKITIPSNIIFSRDEAKGTEQTEVGFIVDVAGALGVNVSGLKVSIPIPAGLQVFSAEFFNQAGASAGAGFVSTTNTAVARTLDFAIGSLRSATVKFKIAADAVNGAKLRNNTTANGYTTAPIKVAPNITGNYKIAAPPPQVPVGLRTLSAVMNASVTAVTADKPLAATSALGVLPLMSNDTIDSNVFVGRCTPATVKRGGTFAYTIFVGNLNGDNGLSSGTITMKVPVGCTAIGFKRYAYNTLQYNGVESSGSGLGDIFPVPTDKNGDTAPRDGTWATPVPATKEIKLDLFSLLPSEGGAMQFIMKVDDKFKGNRIDDSSCVFDAVNVSGKSAGPVGVVVLDGNEITDQPSTVKLLLEGLGCTVTPEVRDAMAASLQMDAQTTLITGSGCQMLQLTNGTCVVQMPKDRVMVLGRSDRVACNQPTRLPLDGNFRIAMGPGTTSGGITMTKIPTYLPAIAFNPNALLISASEANGIVAAGGGNIVAAGGGNIVAAGGGNLTTNTGVHFTPPEGAPATYFVDSNGEIIGEHGAGIIGEHGAGIVAAGGGNIVAAGGGNIVAAGGGNLIGQDGQSLQAKDPLGIVAAGGGNIVAAGGGNIVAAGGGNIVAAGGGNIVAAGGGNIVAAGGGNLAPANFK